MPAVSPARARQLFALVNSRTCCPASATAPCIPYLYPDDGCWGRAHEMCRLMLADGASPNKVWIYGSLTVQSRNKPNCVVNWGWHVAPTLEVNTGTTVETWVVDPSLFAEPVPRATWAGVQGDPGAQLVPTGPEVFYRSSGGWVQHDPSYTETNNVLETYRNQLRLRTASSAGPPPYLNCMVLPPRVQFFGTLAARQTHTWFTWGWNAAWDVIWTVMPLTPCPGGPQVELKTKVERTGSTCTYWLTVTNVTGEAVRFEARYDVVAY